MNFNFDFNCLKKGAPVVTLSSSGISCNLASVRLLDNPEYVIVGFDSDCMALGIKASPAVVEGVPTYPFYSRLRNDWVKIGGRGFLCHLSRVSRIDFISKAKQFIPEFDEESNTLVVYVDEKHLKDAKD